MLKNVLTFHCLAVMVVGKCHRIFHCLLNLLVVCLSFELYIFFSFRTTFYMSILDKSLSPLLYPLFFPLSVLVSYIFLIPPSPVLGEHLDSRGLSCRTLRLTLWFYTASLRLLALNVHSVSIQTTYISVVY
jgi:hypothetical protein